MQPLSQAIMLEAFEPKDRGKAMAFFGIGVVVAPVLGPVLGGWLTDNYSWRWVFYVNVPFGVAAYAMLRANVFDPPYITRGTAGIDYWGIGLLAIGIAALQIGLDQGQQEDWFSSDLIIDPRGRRGRGPRRLRRPRAAHARSRRRPPALQGAHVRDGRRC